MTRRGWIVNVHPFSKPETLRWNDDEAVFLIEIAPTMFVDQIRERAEMLGLDVDAEAEAEKAVAALVEMWSRLLSARISAESAILHGDNRQVHEVLDTLTRDLR